METYGLSLVGDVVVSVFFVVPTSKFLSDLCRLQPIEIDRVLEPILKTRYAKFTFNDLTDGVSRPCNVVG